MDLATADAFEPSPKRHAVAHAWLTVEQHQALDDEAQRRRMHPDQLLAQVAAIVIDDDWFGTLLDK